ncbi:MAG TPA: protease inhibitor I42 family protein [Sedimentisphaerales bacterium]|nr:protease inhibitor I42 family protein [Sedimentisphaerales bacterium]
MKKTILFVLVLAFGLTTEVANADFVFGDMEPLPEPINTPGIISGDFTMTADGLEAYFVSMNRPGGYGREDIWVCRRQSTEDGWGPAVNLGPKVNTSVCESQPCISADGMELYFSDVSPWGTPARSGGHGGGDIWVTRRANRDDEWAVPVNLGPTINSSSMETYPNISADGLSLHFSDGDLWLATRPTRDDNWSARVRVKGGVNTGSWEGFPNLSADQRVLLFYSDRSGGYGGMDIYMTMRPTVFDAWGPAVNLGPKINTPYYDISPSLSVDGCTFHFTHNDMNGWGGNYKICRTTISPVVDLNGDGVVDCVDMCEMVDHWGTDEQLYDIGPTPWGDGIVDVQDLIVLAEHLFEGIPPVELEEVNVDEEDDGGQVELEQGQILVVTLESNPTTGYGWEVVENQESILEQMGEAEFKQSDTGEPPLVGAGGWEIFRFKAVSAGQMTLQLVYRRSWEEDVEPLNTFSLQVVVR